jgi:hypothetical protein
MYLINDTCTSACPECGRVCDSMTVVDASSLLHFTSPASSTPCHVLVGDLTLDGLALTSEHMLEQAFASVTTLHGLLYVLNTHITSLRFFKSLVSVRGIVLRDNIDLVDAVLPGIASSTDQTVEYCPRLCQMRYPVPQVEANSIATPSECNDVLLMQLFSVEAHPPILANSTELFDFTVNFTYALTTIASEVYGDAFEVCLMKAKCPACVGFDCVCLRFQLHLSHKAQSCFLKPVRRSSMSQCPANLHNRDS